MRATSSIRSISRVRSRRQLGGTTSTRCGFGPQLAVAQAPRGLPARLRRGSMRCPGCAAIAQPQHDRARAAAGTSTARRSLPPANSPPASSRISRTRGGWPNRPLRDRRRARSGTTNRCAGSAAGPWCGSTADRTRPLRAGRRSCAAETSVAAPPITPPSATGCRGVGNHAHAGLERRRFCGRWPRSVSPLRASRTMIRRPLKPARSKACSGWPHSIST